MWITLWVLCFLPSAVWGIVLFSVFYFQKLYPSQWYTEEEGQIDKYFCIRIFLASFQKGKKNSCMSKYEWFLELILQDIDSDNDLGEEVSQQESHLIQFSSWLDFKMSTLSPNQAQQPFSLKQDGCMQPRIAIMNASWPLWGANNFRYQNNYDPGPHAIPPCLQIFLAWCTQLF